MKTARCQVSLLSMTPDAQSLVYAAFRQCYHDGWVADMWTRLTGESPEIPHDKQAAFIEETLRSGHASPIEHVSFSFAITGVSRALTHQLVRHRIASFSQQSQRYVDGSDFACIVPPNIAKDPIAMGIFEQCMSEIGETYRVLKARLEELGHAKKAAEDARFVLPQAAETRIVVTMHGRSLLNFFEHRCCLRAQWEIRGMAEQMLAICRRELPSVFQLAGAKCERTGFCAEGEKFTCGKKPLGATKEASHG